MSEHTGASRNTGTESDQVTGNVPSTCGLRHNEKVTAGCANVRVTLGKSVLVRLPQLRCVDYYYYYYYYYYYLINCNWVVTR
jgi:hypothetical protein